MEIPEIVRQWYAVWQTLTPIQHFANVLAGIFGACVQLAWRGAPIKLPQIDKKKGVVELNFIGTILMGAGAAFILDVGVPVSVIAGVTAPVLITFASRLVIRSAYIITSNSGLGNGRAGDDN